MNQHYSPPPPPPGYNQQLGNQGGFMPMQQDLPNSSGVFVLGILSLVFSGGIGLILAVIALVMSNNALNAYRMNPQAYTEKSHARVKTGRICAIIELCLVGLALLILVLVFSFAF